MQGKNRQPTERISPVGRPIWQDEKGVDYSEKTVTFPYKDKWVTFPSVDQNGNVLSEEEVEAYVLENGPVDPITGEVFPLFDSLEDATSFAQDRSKMLGGFNKGGLLDEDRQTQEAFDAVTGEAMAITPPRVEDQEAGRVRQNEITLESVPGFDRPMSANPNDEIVGQDELTGKPIYETALGQRYTLSLNPDQRTFRTRFEEDILPGMQGYLENPTLPTVSQIGDFAVDTVKGAYEGLEGAVQGRGTLGDVTGLAVGSGAGSVFGEVPEGAIRIFGGFNAARDPGIDASGRQLPRSVGAENLPRFEIDDSVARYNPQNLVEKDFSGRRLDTVDWDMVNTYPGRFLPTLDQVIDHPELFRQYPELAKVNIIIDTSLTQTINGYYHPDKNLIAVSRDTADDPDLFAETLLHEVQHDVQKREGFDVGTSPESDIVGIRQASQIAQNPEAEEDIRYLGYYGKSGEVESRNVGDRKYLTLDERFETPPIRTESVNRGRQWIVDESGNIKDAVDLFGTGEENRGGFLRRLGNLLRGRRGSQYNSGGVVSMEEQMSLFEMGGLADDGAMRDPVSGNEVPPGSLATEVRDDVPAMLSEGEYIVPADVVRYYGVKFFEDLRMGAKSGLNEMEQTGRIGGEPVGSTPGDEPLTPEEMQMLAEITGMYGGGMVRKGYQQGGMVNTPFTPTPNYTTPGFSLFQPLQPAAPTTPVQVPQTETVTLYGPNGEIATLTLPTDQERYNALIGQGYSTQQQVRQPSVQGGDSGGDSVAPGVVPTAPGLGADAQLDFTPLGTEEYNAFLEDPLKVGAEALKGKDYSRFFAGAGAINPVLGLIGGAVGAGMTAQNVAQARAASQIAKAKGLDTTALDTQIESYISGLPNLSRVSSDLLASGDQMAERFFNTAMDLRLGGEYGPAGIGRDFFVEGPAGDTAYTKFMEENAPEGMVFDPTIGVGEPILTYNEQTKKFEDRGEVITEGGGYRREDGQPGSSYGPTTSIVPTLRPDRTSGTSTTTTVSDSSSDRDSGGDRDTNVGNWGGDRDGDGTPNWRDFDDGVGWADTNKDSGGGSGSGGGGYSCYVATALTEEGYWSNTKKLKLIKWCIDTKPEGSFSTKLWRNGYVTFGKKFVAPFASNKLVKWFADGYYESAVNNKKNFKAMAGFAFFTIPSYSIGLIKALIGKLVDIERT